MQKKPSSGLISFYIGHLDSAEKVPDNPLFSKSRFVSTRYYYTSRGVQPGGRQVSDKKVA
jgi:hypothetical protein